MIYQQGRKRFPACCFKYYSVSYGIRGTHLDVISPTLSILLAIFNLYVKNATCDHVHPHDRGKMAVWCIIYIVWKCQKP